MIKITNIQDAMMLDIFAVEFKEEGILLVDKMLGTGGAYFIASNDPELTWNMGLGSLLTTTYGSFLRDIMPNDVIDFNVQDSQYKHLL